MQTINVAGGNLYALAARYLGDATQWTRIALQNGITDPFLPNTAMSLVIPDVDKTQTGGVPPQ